MTNMTNMTITILKVRKKIKTSLTFLQRNIQELGITKRKLKIPQMLKINMLP